MAVAAVTGLLALVLAAGVAWARSLSEAEEEALASAVSSFNAAMREGNDARLAEAGLPPKALAAMAHNSKMTPEAFVATSAKAWQVLRTGNPRFESFELDLGTAIRREHANGTPYVLIPNHVISEIRGKRVRNRSHTVALLEEGKWYLLSIGVLQMPPLREVYPEFAGVDFPPSSTEMLNQ